MANAAMKYNANSAIQYVIETAKANTPQGMLLSRVIKSLGICNKGVRKDNVITGRTQAGALAGLARDALVFSVRAEAENRLNGIYESGSDEPLARNALTLLTFRLRSMKPNECPLAIRDAFMNIMGQEDFLQNERSGDTIRSMKRKQVAEERRRAAGIKPRNFKKVELSIVKPKDEDELSEKEEREALRRLSKDFSMVSSDAIYFE